MTAATLAASVDWVDLWHRLRGFVAGVTMVGAILAYVLAIIDRERKLDEMARRNDPRRKPPHARNRPRR